MARQQRQDSATGIFHVTSRGAGRRNLFEDDEDRLLYLSKLQQFSARNAVSILAWCLMSNHVHLLLSCALSNLTALMRAQNTAYAQHFNGRHGHIGPVFQGRFTSIPVENEPHLLETVRYIHLNPQAAGLETADDYRWSSFNEYANVRACTAPRLCDTSLVLGLLDDFIGFHHIKGLEIDIVEMVPARQYRSDSEMTQTARSIFGSDFADSIASLPRSERDARLRQLHSQGASIRQLERITGIGRGIIQDAVKSRWG